MRHRTFGVSDLQELQALLSRLLVLSVLLAACGGSGGAPSSSGTSLHGTLVYALTECEESPGVDGRTSLRQSLRTQTGEGDPVTIATFDVPAALPMVQQRPCFALGRLRSGLPDTAAGPLQRIGLSPDASTIVFEVTDDFSILGEFLQPEQEGIFVVHPDGSGLRRLAPPSREPLAVGVPGFGITTITTPTLAFSPSGRKVVFTDRGPGLDGEEAGQVVTLDLATGQRTQATHLPRLQRHTGIQNICCPQFLDENIVGFPSFTNANGLNPNEDIVGYTLNLETMELRLANAVAAPGSQFLETFVITGLRPAGRIIGVDGVPVNNPISVGDQIIELFLVDGQNLLQLTNFHREDTGTDLGSPPIFDARRQRIFFTASADPFGQNPSEDCQIFSIDRNGADLQQLTFFHEAEHSQTGCIFDSRPRGCATLVFGQDRRTGTVLFYSSCDPLGTNPNGGQIFAVQANGSGLRQLTNAQGFTFGADRSSHTELPSHWAYGPY